MRALQLRESELSASDVALLLAATAAARPGSYCSLAWGTRLAEQASTETAARVLAGSATALDPRSAALSDWARRRAVDPNATTPADVGRLRDMGMTDRQIFEATMLIAWRMAFTAVNDALGAQPDAQLAPVRAAVRYGRPPSQTPYASSGTATRSQPVPEHAHSAH
jgi:alkylhydroperoxidase family enzyme